jgi:hypothetical protein
MTRITRIVLLALVTLVLVVAASPAFADGDESETAGDTTETTVAAVPISAGEEPAVVVPPAELEDVEQPWTARFLIPLLVVTAIVLIIGVAIAYNRSVRTRYKVTA